MMRDRWYRCLLGVLCILSAGPAWSSLPLTRARTTPAFAPLSIQTGAMMATAVGDESVQNNIPIGFDFSYLGTHYAVVSASSNGWMSFNNSAAQALKDNQALLQADKAANRTLAPWWDDLSTESLLYQTQGTQGARVFTLQWQSFSDSLNLDRRLRFQVKLFESDHSIEFQYEPVSFTTPIANHESASIGLTGANTGPGDFLDAVTGSDQVGTFYLNSDQWPTHAFRFAPGLSPALAAGRYTVGQGGDFANLSEALAALNQRGVAGAVELSLLDSTYDESAAGGSNWLPFLLGPVAGSSAENTITIQPAQGRSTLSQIGSPGEAGLVTNNHILAANREPILALIGTDFVTIRRLDLRHEANNSFVDVGLLVSNASATDGATKNLVEDVLVNLGQQSMGKFGILQATLVPPGSAIGANNANTYRDFRIYAVEVGIALAGHAQFPDYRNLVTASSLAAPNLIGGDGALGIKGQSPAGIAASDQDSLTIERNIIRNVSGTTGTIDGLSATNLHNYCWIVANRINQVHRDSASSTAATMGMRVSVANTLLPHIFIANNFVSNIGSNYAGPTTSTRTVVGMAVQPIAIRGDNFPAIYVFNNSVLINLPDGFAASSAAVVFGPGQILSLTFINNLFANLSGAQTSPAGHYVFAVPTGGLYDSWRYQGDYNSLVLANTANGSIGLVEGNPASSLSDWQTRISSDVHSISYLPTFVDAANGDLHLADSQLSDFRGRMVSIDVDIDGDARPNPPGIGADHFVLPDAVFQHSFE